MRTRIPLLLERAGDGPLRLLSPAVGTLTASVDRGAALAPGQVAGTLLRLGRAVDLVVPEGAGGMVLSPRPERVQAPTNYGDVVVELDPSAAAVAADATPLESAGTGGPVLRADQSGRFYHRAAPGDEPFVHAGSLVEDGTPVGLIEVMKTYRHVVYRPGNGLPASARVVRVVAEDGADVEAGAPLLEVETA